MWIVAISRSRPAMPAVDLQDNDLSADLIIHTVNRPTLTGSRNLLGPALPGLKYSTPCFVFLFRRMAVAIDDGCESCCFWL